MKKRYLGCNIILVLNTTVSASEFKYAYSWMAIEKDGLKREPAIETVLARPFLAHFSPHLPFIATCICLIF